MNLLILFIIWYAITDNNKESLEKLKISWASWQAVVFFWVSRSTDQYDWVVEYVLADKIDTKSHVLYKLFECQKLHVNFQIIEKRFVSNYCDRITISIVESHKIRNTTFFEV